MITIIDYRNGRYQGQVLNQKPHGVGVFMSVNLTLIFSEWIRGQMSGSTIIIYPDGSTFYGQVLNGNATNVCVYELQNENIKLYTLSKGIKDIKIAAIVPIFKLILQLDPNLYNVLRQFPYNQQNDDINTSNIIKILENDKIESRNLEHYSNFRSFFRTQFVVKYGHIFEELVLNSNGYLQYWIGFREEGLGVRIQPLTTLQDRTNNCKSYIIRQMGLMTKENVLQSLGFKSVNHMIKGFQIEQGVFGSYQNTMVYNLNEKRPTKCIQISLNFLKRSLFYKDKYLPTNQADIQKQLMQSANDLLFIQQKQRIAQFTMQNPRNDPQNMMKIEMRRREKKINSEIQERMMSDMKNQSVTQSGNTLRPTQASFNLNPIKQQIYRSVSKKKNNKNSSLVDYSNLTSNLSHATPFSLSDPKEQQSSKQSKAIMLNSKNRKNVSPRRLNGSITPKKQQKPQLNRKQNSQIQKSSKFHFPDKIIQEEKQKIIKRFPAPILKDQKPYQQIYKSKSKKKAVFIEQPPKKQQELKTPTKSPNKKYLTANNNKAIIEKKGFATSPGKRRQLLTENIFS